jgi:hypothetical protein
MHLRGPTFAIPHVLNYVLKSNLLGGILHDYHRLAA